MAAFTGAAVGLVGAASLVAGLASASTIGAGTSARAPAVASAALRVGTYKFIMNGSDQGTISFAADFTYTSTLDGDDAGVWVQAGKSFTFDITSGADISRECVFIGTLTSKTAIGSASSPGRYACPGVGSSGTWYVKSSGAGAVQTSTGVSDTVGSATSASTFATGKYTLFANGSQFGKITYASGHTFSGTVDDDSGSWAAGGNAFGMEITENNGGSFPDDVGCLFVGTLSSAGINSSASPGPYTGCGGGTSAVSMWWAKKK